MPTVTIPLPLTDVTPVRPAIGGLRQHPLKTLVIANGKGGVGKSSLAASLSGVLAMLGKRVLLVELDPQGNNAEDLGFLGTALSDKGENQAQAIIDGAGLKPTGEARPGLWVIPGGERLEDVVEELYVQRRAARTTGDTTWLYMYAAAISQIAGDYDYVILDVAPGSLVLQLQALVAGDLVLVPCRSDASSRKGLRTVSRRMNQARPNNPDLRVLGIVLFGVTSGGHRIAAEIRENLERDIRGAAPVLDTPIRYVERVAVECRAQGLIPQELYRQLADERKSTSDDKQDKQESSLERSARGLAADYRALATEIMTAIIHLPRKAEGTAP